MLNSFALQGLWIKQVKITQNCFDEATGFCSGYLILSIWHIPSAVLLSIIGLNGFLIFLLIISILHRWWQHPLLDSKVCLFEGDLGSFWVLFFNIVHLGLHPAKYIWNPYFVCHYSSKWSYMMISIWWPSLQPNHWSFFLCQSAEYVTFLQVVPHSREYRAQFSPLICKALAKTFSFTWASPHPLCHHPLFEPFGYVTDRSISFTLFRKNPVSELILEAVTLWILTGTEELPHVTLSTVTHYMTFKPLFIIQRAALSLKSF